MPSKPAVKLEHVEKSYNGYGNMVKVFEDVNIEIREGGFLAVMGATGCGKTTLLNLIAGFDHPQSGGIYVDGVDITKLREDDVTLLRRKKIGVTFQAHNLLHQLTVYENVELPLIITGLGKDERNRRVKELLEKTWISQYAERKVANLSVGERYMVAFARALATDPPILLMDEPMENLDPLTTDMMLALLKGESHRKKTLIITTHKRKVAQVASDILHLKRKIP